MLDVLSSPDNSSVEAEATGMRYWEHEPMLSLDRGALLFIGSAQFLEILIFALDVRHLALNFNIPSQPQGLHGEMMFPYLLSLKRSIQRLWLRPFCIHHCQGPGMEAMLWPWGCQFLDNPLFSGSWVRCASDRLLRLSAKVTELKGPQKTSIPHG